MQRTKSVLDMWFPCCLNCEHSGYFSNVDLHCGNCGKLTQLDTEKIENKDGENLSEKTEGLDYDLLHGETLKIVCSDCLKSHLFKMYDNQQYTDSISRIKIEETP